MDLEKYDGKHVRITDKWGETFADRFHRGNRSAWNRRIMDGAYDPAQCSYNISEIP